jgi:hypothetical protein
MKTEPGQMRRGEPSNDNGKKNKERGEGAEPRSQRHLQHLPREPWGSTSAAASAPPREPFQADMIERESLVCRNKSTLCAPVRWHKQICDTLSVRTRCRSVPTYRKKNAPQEPVIPSLSFCFLPRHAALTHSALDMYAPRRPDLDGSMCLFCLNAVSSVH